MACSELLLGHSRHFLTKVIVMLFRDFDYGVAKVLQCKKKNGLAPEDPEAVFVLHSGTIYSLAWHLISD